LLCDTHHRLIDHEDVAGHPVELLKQFKKDHEERIAHVTGLDNTRKTYIITYSANIGMRKGQISPEQVRAAVLAQDLYPATQSSIDLNMTQNATNDDSATFWKTECKNIDGFISARICGLGPDGNDMKHLSIFALAPIPLLMYFGKKLGDILPMDIYQRHRDTEEWIWPASIENGQAYSLDVVRPAYKGASGVILELSLSGLIDPDSVRRTMDEELPWFRLSIPEPNRDHLKSKAQLREFGDLYHRTLSRISVETGEGCTIHMFPAVPVAAAIQMGRNLLPKSDGRILVYDYNRDKKGWLKTICI